MLELFCIPVFVLHARALRYGTFCVGVVRAGAEGEDGVVVVLEGEVRLVVVVVVVVEILHARVGVAQLREGAEEMVSNRE